MGGGGVGGGGGAYLMAWEADAYSQKWKRISRTADAAISQKFTVEWREQRMDVGMWGEECDGGRKYGNKGKGREGKREEGG